MKDSFVFHIENAEDLEDLTAEEMGQIFLAMVEYQKTGAEPDFKDRVLRVAWKPIFRRLKTDNAKYNAQVNVNTENGSKGGAPKGNQNARKNNRKQPETTENNRKQPETTLSVSDSVSDSVSVEEEVEEEDNSVTVILADGSLHRIPEERIADLQKAFPEVDVRAELVIMAETMRASPDKRRTATRIDHTALKWLQIAREQALQREKTAKAKADAGKKKNDFHNFQQHSYDFDAIERALYDHDMREIAAMKGGEKR